MFTSLRQRVFSTSTTHSSQLTRHLPTTRTLSCRPISVWPRPLRAPGPSYKSAPILTTSLRFRGTFNWLTYRSKPLDTARLHPRDIPINPPTTKHPAVQVLDEVQKLFQANVFLGTKRLHPCSRGQAPLSRIVAVNPLVKPQYIGHRGSAEQLIDDRGVHISLGAHICYPWYLLRTVRSNLSSNPNAYSIWTLYDILGPGGPLTPNRNTALKYLIVLAIMANIGMFFHLRSLVRSEFAAPDIIMATSVFVPIIGQVEVGNQSKKLFFKTKTPHDALPGVVGRTTHFSDAATSDKPRVVKKLIEDFNANHFHILTALLFAFHHTPVTASIRSLLIEHVIPKLSDETIELIEKDPAAGGLKHDGRVTLSQFLNNTDPATTTPLQQRSLANMAQHLNDAAYRDSLFTEMIALANLRRGFEALLKFNNETTLSTNSSLAHSLPILLTFSFLPGHHYENISDYKTVPHNKEECLVDLQTIFTHSPLAQFSTIRSPDLEAALAANVKYPTTVLTYASVVSNIKSVLQESLPLQGTAGSFVDKPTPQSLLATLQLIPADLLQLYPVIPNDNTSLTLAQALLLTDLALGQLLSEYQRVSTTTS